MILAVVLAGFATAGSLYEQTVVRLLAERFSSDRVSYLLVDARDGRLVGSRWPAASEPVAIGSLVKPFTALAYGERHRFRFPEFTCEGARSGCWLPRGHGRIGITQAIAHSCNAYFDSLASGVRFEEVAAVALRFGIAAPPAEAPPEAYAGREGLWRVAPLDLARAYGRLLADGDAGFVRQGMAECARSGTARAVGSGLAKTGTAPCSHAPLAPGDGFVVIIDPAESPRYILLVRVHGVTGSVAAVTAGQMVRILRYAR